jgi:hypothetical protein
MKCEFEHWSSYVTQLHWNKMDIDPLRQIGIIAMASDNQVRLTLDALMIHQVETSPNPQQPNRFRCCWLFFGITTVVLTAGLSLVLQTQWSLQTELKDLRREVASAGQLSKSVLNKVEAQQLVVDGLSSTTKNDSYSFPTDRMFRILPDELRPED